jgi:hypothetical protein
MSRERRSRLLHNIKPWWMLIPLALVLGACSPDVREGSSGFQPPPDPTTAVPSPTTAPSSTPEPPSPATLQSPSPSPSPTEVDWLSVSGRTQDELPTLGNPDAPVTLIDYSDFM